MAVFSTMDGAQTIRALWIDDEPAGIQPIVALLGREDIHAEVIANPRIGLARALRGSLDVILLDERMPDLTGSQILEEFSRHGVCTPTIVVTAYGSIDSAVHAMKLGAVDFLVKPCRAPSVIRAVRDAVKKRREEPLNAQPDRLTGVRALLSDITAMAEMRRDEEHALQRIRRELAAILTDADSGLNDYVRAAAAFARLVLAPVSKEVVGRVRAMLAVRRPGTHFDSTVFRAFPVWRRATRSEVAAHVGAALGALDRTLVSACGVDFVHVRRHMAVRQAVALMVSTPIPLKHMAIDLAYEHQTAMARDFRICLAVSPRAFRRDWISG